MHACTDLVLYACTAGDPSYFISDGVHCNQRGYCSAIGDNGEVQRAFGCLPGKYRCAAAPMESCVKANPLDDP